MSSKSKIQIIIFVIIYLLMLAAMFILPGFSMDGYSILRNTTSQLGAQSTPNAWYMNILFILLGAYSIYYFRNTAKGWVTKISLLTFGISLLLTGIFRMQSIDNSLEFNQFHDTLHSIFATVTGFGFCILAFLYGISQKERFNLVLGISISLFGTLLSIGMANFEPVMGVLQRTIFITAFAWMIYEGWRGRVKHCEQLDSNKLT